MAKSSTSFKKGNTFGVHKGLRGEIHPKWKGGEKMNAPYRADYRKKLRQAVLEALGNKCNRCGFDDYRALQIDHIAGGGSKERKERVYKCDFNKHVMQSFLNNENKYQLLCANCNWIKRFENNERNLT